jgi:hypothetical protein
MLVDAISHSLGNHVERCLNKLKCSRRFATRYYKTEASYLGPIHIIDAYLWVRSFPTWTKHAVMVQLFWLPLSKHARDCY